MDSYEGAEAYRMAVYGYDLYGFPVRNLIRHKREYPSGFDQGYSLRTGRPSGTDPAHQSTDDDYEQRRARTPVPMFMQEAINLHLSKVYNREIKREGPAGLVEWWKNVDGLGTTIDQYMTDVIAPLLMTYGQLDLIFDFPTAPQGTQIGSMADVYKYNLGDCIMSYILPENLVWWLLDEKRRYKECVVREVGESGIAKWRYWNAEGWVLYDAEGMVQAHDRPEQYDPYRQGLPTPGGNAGDTGGQGGYLPIVQPHPFGVVPIVRVFDKRRFRAKNIGYPRYEAVAEIQREYYNRDSELVISDTTQAFPLLSVPEDFITPDGSIGVGPNWVMPMKRIENQGGVTGYQAAQYVDPPKGAADSLRINKSDLRDNADRICCLTKPAGSAGTSGATVGQSGLSKRLDVVDGNELLGKISGVLQKVEETIAEFSTLVMTKGKTKELKEGDIRICYPRQFDLWSSMELAQSIVQFQLILQQAGQMPETESELLRKLVRIMLPGLDDELYEEIDKEIDDTMEVKEKEHKENKEATKQLMNQQIEGEDDDGPETEFEGEDASDQGGGTIAQGGEAGEGSGMASSP